jgi:hypothetical protein
MSRNSSLRSLVEKWVGLTHSTALQLSRTTRSDSNGQRVLRVDSALLDGPIFFFRHHDGSWCIFPERASHPTMSLRF